MHFPVRFIFSIALLLLAGCATSQPQAAFPSVQQQANQHAGVDVRWPLTENDRAAADAAVKEILASDLTIDAAVNIALLNNRTLRATFEELGLSQARLAAATRLPNPAFDASVRWPDHAPRGPNVEFGLSAPLFDALLLPARKRAAANDLLQTQYRASHEILVLVAEVRGAVYEILAQQQLGERLAVSDEVARATADVARRQFDAGNISQLEFGQIGISAEQTQLQLAQAKAGVIASREKLNRLLGLNAGQIHWKIAGSLPALPATDPLPENSEATARASRLDLAALQTQVATAQQTLQARQRTRLLTGMSSIGIDTERESAGEKLTGPRASLELPLFDQGQPELARLAAEARQAADRAEALSAEIGSEVRSASAALEVARQTVEFYQRTLLPQREALLRESLLHYNAMQKGVYELLAAKEQQQATEREAIAALRDYWLARVALERALGQRLASPAAERTDPIKLPSPGTDYPAH